VRDDAQQSQAKGEAVDDAEQELQDDDKVDESRQDLLGHDGMLLDELGEIIQARGWRPSARF